MPLTNSEADLEKYVKDSHLWSATRWRNLKAKGWCDMTSYAFAWGDLTRDTEPEDFNKVVAQIERSTWGAEATYPAVVGFGNVKAKVEEPPWHLYRQTRYEARCAVCAESNKR